MTKSYLMSSLIDKMQSPDQDHRYMGLSDLMSEIKLDASNFVGDESMEDKVLAQVLKLLEDKISEVKNQAVKCLGLLVKILRESQMDITIGKLVDYSNSRDEELRDISGLALKTITAELPQSSHLAPRACETLTPKLLNQIENTSTPPQTLIETLSILSILISRFPAQLSNAEFQPQPIPAIVPLLTHSRPAVRKRAIVTLSQFLPTVPQSQFDDLVKTNVLPGLRADAGESLEVQRTTVQLVAAMVRHSPARMANVLDDIIPGVLKAAASVRDDDELREYALQALEVFAIRCPGEISPFLGQIVQTGTRLIKYDPNYAGGDETEDEVMAEADGADEEEEDDDDDDDGLEYSDDEDTSYKIRRSATKLLAALIDTRPEMLTSLYKDVSPVLIQRFGDREETVRLEVWATYGGLLDQTKVYGGTPQDPSIMDSPGVGGKRKRASSTSDGMDFEMLECPIVLLRSQVPSLAKALLSQLRGSKTPSAVLQAGFTLLHRLLVVLPGCLSAHVTPVASIAESILRQSPVSTGITLYVSCLSFLSIFFATHDQQSFSNVLPDLTPVLLKALNERHPRILSETFRVFSTLLNALLQPIPNADWIGHVYVGAVERLAASDTDAEVRACAEVVVGDLWVCAPDVVRLRDGREWDAMCRTTGRVDGAVKVVTRVAQRVPMSDTWINASIDWLLQVLRKADRLGKLEAFIGLDALLRKYQNGIPAEPVAALLEQMKPYITINDIPLLSNSLNILSLLLELAPNETYPVVEADFLRDIYLIAHSPLLAGSSFDSVLTFFSELVEADCQIATHAIPSLTLPLQKVKKAEASYINVARCIGAIVQSHHPVAAGTVAEFSKSIRSGSKATPTQVSLSLLILGEIGRRIDFSNQKGIFATAVELLGSTDEEIRGAAAFATGNIAVGNLQLFLPTIVKLVQTDKDKRLLALHALKEVVSNCPPSQLENVAETIWVPLFQDSANSEDSTRNVAAACLGKLTTTNATRYLPQLQARIHDEDPAARATVIAAIRYVFADPQRSYDELLSSLVPEFLSVMEDDDLTVRRLAMSALNAAARNKPRLIREHLPVLLPHLYRETHVRAELIHTVQMGPWTHKVDDGLETRKAAYETMYTLLDTCLAKLDLHEFMGRVVAALTDDADEIKVIGHLVLFRLSSLALSSPLSLYVPHSSPASPPVSAAALTSTPTTTTISNVSPIHGPSSAAAAFTITTTIAAASTPGSAPGGTQGAPAAHAALLTHLDAIAGALATTLRAPTISKDTVKQDLERAAEVQRSTLRAIAALARAVSSGPAGSGGTSTPFEVLVEDVKKGPRATEFMELSRV